MTGEERGFVTWTTRHVVALTVLLCMTGCRQVLGIRDLLVRDAAAGCDGNERRIGSRCYPVDCPAQECGEGQVCAGGVCVDDGCVGVSCPDSETCSAGVCQPVSCESPHVACGGSCRDIANDPVNCGQCGTICSGATNATGLCAAGMCRLRCADGYGNCDGTTGNGCETLLGSVDHCRSCDEVCDDGNPLRRLAFGAFTQVKSQAGGEPLPSEPLLELAVLAAAPVVQPALHVQRIDLRLAWDAPSHARYRTASRLGYLLPALLAVPETLTSGEAAPGSSHLALDGGVDLFLHGSVASPANGHTTLLRCLRDYRLPGGAATGGGGGEDLGSAIDARFRLCPPWGGA
jgi:hypothetical protein